MFFIFAWAALPAAAGPRKPVSHVKEYANEVAFWNARRTMWVDDANTQAGGLQDAITQMEDAQASGSQDAVNAWIFNPSQVAVARKGLKGLWASSPIFANDMSTVSWQ